MEKEFNITGTCIPEMHYMVDTSDKLNGVMQLINKGKYFIINRPRQYGKTTTLFLLNKQLKNSEDYISIKISFEGIGDLIFEDEEVFSRGFLEILEDSLFLEHEELADFLEQQKSKVKKFKDLSKVITKFIIKANKKVILMIDEVDKSSNNQLFLSFLGMLRNKYLLRNEGADYTFHSIILAGVHDVKSLKIKIRPGEEQKYNSPWNIATDFDIDMSFSVEEIETMLDDYVKSKKVKLDKTYFSERLYYYTSGYPFLVSKLCKIIDEKIMPENELVWKKEYMDMAVKLILKDSNTNFDSLIKNIENNDELYYFVENIILKGERISYIKTDEIIN
ncbi:MAG: AAA family ATPase, partial [Clostridiaceae bacterium]